MRAALLACLLVAVVPVPAAADWYFTPFLGYDFKGTTTFIDEYRGRERSKTTFGGSAAVIVGIFGVEADYAFVPRFFQSPEPPLGTVLARSHVQTFTGNFILAAPLALTRESLRPYLVVGIGWMDAVAQEAPLELLPIDTNLTAFSVGGGAIGMLGARTGLRFDLRRFTNIDDEPQIGSTFGRPRVTFWRASVGLTLRH